MEEINKDQLYSHIDSVLKSANFKSIEDKCWLLEETRQQPGMQMNINGQVSNIPGKSTQIRKTIKVVGEGDVDGREFAQIVYTVETSEQEDQWQNIETGIPEECIYFDDTASFDYWISHP